MLELTSRPCMPALQAAVTQVHTIPGQHINNVVSLIRFMVDGVKNAEHMG
jgi:hypothetical protein